MVSNGTLIEIPRSDGRQGIRVNPLLVSAITRYEVAGQDRPNKCLVHVLGASYKVGHPADVIADMLGLTVVFAKIPDTPAEKDPGASAEKDSPPSPAKGNAPRGTIQDL